MTQQEQDALTEKLKKLGGHLQSMLGRTLLAQRPQKGVCYKTMLARGQSPPLPAAAPCGGIPTRRNTSQKATEPDLEHGRPRAKTGQETPPSTA